jgi:Leucine-rich repeat (LRR) protein
LTMLYLGFNQISEIPDTITELKNLTTLDLSGNEISEIPGAITKLKYLKELELGHNPIEFPPSYIIEAGVQSIGDYYDYVNNVILVRYREQNPLQIERSIEFLPEYWTAGNSILSYFSHILSVKYPNQNIKVKIEQEGLLLRMIIDTPEGTTETIEKAFNDYVMVISRKLPPESLLTDPFEVMALKNKLENAELELRQTQKLFADKDRQRIESLEMQVSQLNSLNSQFYGLFSKMIENFPHNPIYMNQFTNHNQNANIANQANQINDHGQQNANHFNQNQDKNTAEILKIINNLRQITSQFPPQNQEDILIDLEDVETELQKPESDRNLPKLKKRLMALLTASTIIAAPVANLTDFTNNITDLAQKAGIGLLH